MPIHWNYHSYDPKNNLLLQLLTYRFAEILR